MMFYQYLIFSLIIFAIGVYGVLTRRSAIGILMSLELIFNSANINLVVFNRYLDLEKSIGLVFPVFIIAIAAAEAAIGLALILTMYRHVKSTYTERMDIMKW